MGIGIILLALGFVAGEAILLGAVGGYYFSAIEKLITKKNVYTDNETDKIA